MAPPCFSDIGKKFKDLYGKHFPAGFLKGSVKFAEAHGMATNFNGSLKLNTGQFSPNLDLKIPFKLLNMDVTCTEKWTASNELCSIFEIKPTNDLTNSLEITLEPKNVQTSIKTKNSYKSELITASGDIKFKTLKPEICLSLMTNLLQSVPLYGGGTITFDTQKHKINDISYGLQLDKGDICLSSIANSKDFNAQIYMKLSEKMEIGIENGWNLDTKKSKFAGVSQLTLESGSQIKAKIESSGILSFGYTLAVNEGIKATLGMKLNGKNLTSGGHEYGLEIEF